MDFDPPHSYDPDLEATFGRPSKFSFSELPSGRIGVSDRWAVGAKRRGRVIWLDADGCSHRTPCVVKVDVEREARRRFAAWERRFGVDRFAVHVAPILTWSLWAPPT